MSSMGKTALMFTESMRILSESSKLRVIVRVSPGSCLTIDMQHPTLLQNRPYMFDCGGRHSFARHGCGSR